MTKRGLVFCAAGALVAWLIYFSFWRAESQCQRQQAAYSASTTRDHGSDKVSDFAFDRPWLPCLVKRATAEYQPNDATEHEKRDLAAQEAAVGVAFWVGAAVALIALLQLIATVWGLIYIRGTLRATLEAVDDTNQATKAMKRQTEIAEEVAFRDLRPYVCLDRPKVSNFSEGEEFKFTGFTMVWHNVGRTPAKVTSLIINLVVINQNDPLPDFSSGKPTGSSILGPTGDVSTETMVVMADDLQHIKDTGKRIVLWSRITYKPIDNPTPEWITETGSEVIITVTKLDKAASGMYRFKSIDQYSRMT
jgi:hypothetical protein